MEEITPSVLYIPSSTWLQTNTHGGSEVRRVTLEMDIFPVPIDNNKSNSTRWKDECI